MSGSNEAGGEIAIVGMSGRFPGAASVAALWRMLCEGREGVQRLGDAELRAAGVDEAVLRHPDYVPVTGRLEDTDSFDCSFFGYSEQEAAQIDPQHRLFMECAWHALEDAGCVPESFPGSIGIFAGAGLRHAAGVSAAPSGMPASFASRYSEIIATGTDFLTTRLSYKLDLRGPSIAIQTACSTSLVAVHMACVSLQSGECDLALAGAVSVQTPQAAGYLWQEGGIASRDGTCRAFDRSATGTVPASGVAIVALRRLEDALRDGNHIHAVIRGSAINNDGGRKIGFTAPGISGQSDAIVLAQGGVDPRTVGMLEAHGTGTALGDAAEIAALMQVFCRHPYQGQFCALGSIKSNIGHLDAASGVAGLIKAALCLEHARLVPSLHVEQPNAALTPESPFFLVREARAWPERVWPRRAGVSSFGIGGTNAHVLLEEPPAREALTVPGGPEIFPLSARTASALKAAMSSLARHLQEAPHLDLADVARTLQEGRKAFQTRAAIVARDRQELIGLLERGVGASSSTVDDALLEQGVTVRVGAGTASVVRAVRGLAVSHGVVRESVARGIAEAPSSCRQGLHTWFHAAGGPEGDASLLAAAIRIAENALLDLLASWGTDVHAIVAGDRREEAGEALVIDLHGDSRHEGAGAHRPVLFDARWTDASEYASYALATCWQLGLHIDWKAVRGSDARQLIPLPGYPFERRRLVRSTRNVAAMSGRMPETNTDPGFFVPVWRALPLRPHADVSQAKPSHCLIVGSGRALEDRLEAHLKSRGMGVTSLVAATHLREHVEETLRALQAGGTRPTRIFYCGGLAGQVESVCGALEVIQAFESASPRAPLSFIALTSGAACVPADDDVQPEPAGIEALGAVLRQEHPNVTFTMVDLPPPSQESTASLPACYFDWLAQEAEARSLRPVVAYRRHTRLVREFAREAVCETASLREIREQGVYVITGGLGRTGLALARHLAERYRARLLLLSRTRLPDRSTWEAKIQAADCDAGLAVTLRTLMGIERSATALRFASVDVSDEAAVNDAISTACSELGNINGVFHLAADLAHGSAQRPLRAVRREDLDAQHRPKAAGFDVLDRMLYGRGLDFGVVFSSNSSILGGAGLGAYAASNAFVNAAVMRKRGPDAVPWLAASWDGWNVFDDAGGKDSLDVMTALRALFAIVTHVPGPLVFVSTTDLTERLSATPAAKPAAVEAIAATARADSPREQRPRLRTAYVAPRTELERRIVTIWEQTLGIIGVGVDDDLFDLNGDSLRAMEILAQTEASFGVEVPLRDFVARKPTVFGLCREIAAQLSNA